MTDKEQAVAIYVMIISSIRFADNPTPKVSKCAKQIVKGLKRHYLKSQKNTSIKTSTDEYNAINEKVAYSWDKTRKELVPKDKELDSSLGEIIQHLWDRMNKNKYQKMYVTENTINGCINSFKSHLGTKVLNEEEELVATNNSRKLADRFLELMGIPKQHNLATRLKIQRENLIIERKIA